MSDEGKSKSISRLYAALAAVPEYWIVLRFSTPIAFATLRRRVLASWAKRGGGFSHKKAQKTQNHITEPCAFCAFLWLIPNKPACRSLGRAGFRAPAGVISNLLEMRADHPGLAEILGVAELGYHGQP